MCRDSFIFYRSFYEAINDLPEKNQLKVYKAICEMSLNFKEIELSGLSSTIFKLIKPQLDANNKRYKNGLKGKEYGALGGRPTKPQNKPQNKPQQNPNKTPNNNDNENDNENDNDNDNNNIYSVIEQNFGRTLSTMEIQKIDEWLLLYKRDIIEYAVSIAIMNNKKTFNYINGIIKNWKSCNYETIQEIKDNEIKQHKNEKDVPEWFNQDLNKKKEMDEDEKRIYRKITGSNIE